MEVPGNRLLSVVLYGCAGKGGKNRRRGTESGATMFEMQWERFASFVVNQETLVQQISNKEVYGLILSFTEQVLLSNGWNAYLQCKLLYSL